MVSYTQKLALVRSLTLAHSAVSMALEQATEELLAAAAEEAAQRGVGVATVTCGTFGGPGPITRIQQKRPSSADIENHIRDAWERAQTPDSKARVRKMVADSIDAKTVDIDAGERLRKLCA